MSWLEINKIIASIIVALILFVIIGFISNLLVKNNSDKIQETAYVIEIPESTTSTNTQKGNENFSFEPIENLLINASIESGEKIFKKCSTCHNYSKDGKSKVGPNLWNIINAPKGKVAGFAYSSALIEFGGTWSYEELNKFLLKPKEYIKGTKMNFAGLKKVNDRADLIGWLRLQSDEPEPLP